MSTSKKKSEIGHYARTPLHGARAPVSETAKAMWRELAFLSSPEDPIVWVRQADFAKKLVAAVEKEGAGFDFGHYRDAPAGLRIWCGATVDTADVEALGPWLDWAYASLNA